MMKMFPLMMLQSLNDSMLEALTAMVLTRAPTPIPSQAEGKQNQVGLLLQFSLPLPLSGSPYF